MTSDLLHFNSKNKAHLMMIIALAIVLSVTGCIETNNNIQNNTQLTQPPADFNVTSFNTRAGMEGSQNYIYVDVSVHNFGGEGAAIVWVKVLQDDNKEWIKSQNIYLSSRESTDITLKFPVDANHQFVSQVVVEPL